MKRNFISAVSLLVTVVLLLSSCNNISPIEPSSTVPATEITTGTTITDKEKPAVTTSNETETDPPVVDPEPREIKKTAVSDGVWALDVQIENNSKDVLVVGDYLLVLHVNYEIGGSELVSYSLITGESVGRFGGDDSIIGADLLKLDEDDSFALYTANGDFYRFDSPEQLVPSLVIKGAEANDDPVYYVFHSDGSRIGISGVEISYTDSTGTEKTATISNEYNGYINDIGKTGDTLYLCQYDWMTESEIIIAFDIGSGEWETVKECADTMDVILAGSRLFEKTRDGKIKVSSLDDIQNSAVFSAEATSESIVYADDDIILTSISNDNSDYIFIYDRGGKLLYHGEYDGNVSSVTRMPEGILVNFSEFIEDEDEMFSVHDLLLFSLPELPAAERGVFAKLAKELDEKIEKEFDMTLYTGTEAVIDFPDFYAEPLTDAYSIYIAEKTVYETLKEFPEGFISELFHDTGKGNCTEFVMCMTGELTPAVEYASNYPIAYAYYTDTTQYIVINIQNNYSTKTNVAHELMHAIDRYLEAVNDYNTYPEWSSYLPRKFNYNRSYVNGSGEDYDDPKYTMREDDRVYFIDSYSKTFPKEDRARLFENMFTANEYSSFLEYPYITARMAYLAGYIRENFKSVQNSAETPIWEKHIADEIEAAA